VRAGTFAQTPTVALGQLHPTIRALDSDVAVFDASTVDASILAWVNPLQALATLVALLGTLALGIAAFGVYGVMAYLVSTRTREFGIRIALGATPRRMTRMVLDEAVHLLLVGLLPGVLVASLGSRLAENALRGLMPNDISTWIMVLLAILGVGLLAAYLPARRASRLDPTVALREL
jgi:ABC-type antimicrobial peptide transport system permease subunit